MRIIAYLRVSTESQVTYGRNGIAAQRFACEEWAKKNNRIIHKFYQDAGYSGALPLHRRPGLLQAINDIQKGDILLVYRTDRIARVKKTLYDIKGELERKKCKLLSTMGEGTEATDEYDLNAGIMEDASEFLLSVERRLARVRTKHRMDEKKANNERMGHIPFGFRVCDDGVHLQSFDDEQRIIEAMQFLVSNGTSIRKAAKIMNDRKLLNRNSKPWTHASFFRIVSRQGALAKQK